MKHIKRLSIEEIKTRCNATRVVSISGLGLALFDYEILNKTNKAVYITTALLIPASANFYYCNLFQKRRKEDNIEI